MNRRSWLSALGVSAAGKLYGLSAGADSEANKRPWALSMESFRVSTADQMARLHSYLSGTFLPYLAQVHDGLAQDILPGVADFRCQEPWGIGSRT